MQKHLKERITVTLGKNVLLLIDKRVDEHIFANRSHGFEYLIADMIRKENSDKNESEEE